MLRWLKRLFSQEQVEKLQKENELLKAKLEEKQEHINKTNAYWKKKMHNLSSKNKNDK